MGQYQAGTVDVTNGSPIVTGYDTEWLTYVSVGDAFKVDGISAIYTINSVPSDTQIILSTNYAGATQNGVAYHITVDWTPYLHLAEIWGADKNWWFHLTQNLRTIDEFLRAADIYSGSGTFNGSTGVTINIGATLSGATYSVAITITTSNPINVGAISVESKANNQFVVKNTGSDVTSTFDWIVIDSLSRAADIYSGSGTFNGPTGVTVPIGVTLAGAVYSVAITITTADPVNVGEISVESKAANQFVVKNTGSDITSTFDWILIDRN
uniref:Putative tail protein n=2 Tax=viral metagenome TaxID=1070528 RepID=A0A6H1ZEM3_9ZZZZ